MNPAWRSVLVSATNHEYTANVLEDHQPVRAQFSSIGLDVVRNGQITECGGIKDGVFGSDPGYLSAAQRQNIWA
jgi:hypothetical protein